MAETIMAGIYTIADVLTSAECDEFIAVTEAEGYTAAPITTIRGPKLMPDVRNNKRYMVDDPAMATRIWAKVENHIPPVVGGWRAVGLNERFRFYRYDVGEYFAPHLDGYYQRDNGECSHLTFMIYLNDDFEGGATLFGGISIGPRRGMALVFIHELLHEGAPVTKGRKCVLRSDVMFNALGSLMQR
jgi:predicted 2-oxoglutarate/Fe(II)-dependent dioxygenase YbiX